jgi:hypothetical protein
MGKMEGMKMDGKSSSASQQQSDFNSSYNAQVLGLSGQ